MLHLGLFASPTMCQHVKARVRGAAVDARSETGVLANASQWDAIAVLEDGHVTADDVYRWRQAGKAVLISTAVPLASDLALATLQEPPPAPGGALLLLNPHRFQPSRRLILEQVQDGKLGEPGLVRSHRWEPANAPSAGCFLVQELDLVLAMMGQFPECVFAMQPTRTTSLGDEGSGMYYQIHLGFAGGGMALLDHAAGNLSGNESYGSFSVIGARGSAFSDDHHNHHLLFSAGGARAVGGFEHEDFHAATAMVQDLITGVTNGHDGTSTIEDWLKALKVHHASLRSAQSRRVFAGEEWTHV